MAIEFENNIFKGLIEKYKTWDELSKYLESEEGGLLKIVDKNENGFCLIRYEKAVSKMELPHSKWFRSVVWNTKTNRPVSIAPPKTTSNEFPFKSLKEISDAGVICQELLDGFMINCFRLVDDSTVHITSRSKLDATGKFYSEKSFKDLFMEAYVNTYQTQNSNERLFQDISTPNKSNNEAAVFCSYLVQHQEHRIVKPIEKNIVYLVHRGIVYEDGSIKFEDSPKTVNSLNNIENIKLENKTVQGSYAQIVSQPKDDEECSEVQRWINKYLLNQTWQFQGVVFKDNSGNRWRFRSEKYLAVKSLRGNSSTVKDRFAQLYTQNLIHKYLEYYPEEMMLITVHLMLMNTIVKMLYDNYVDLHITKAKKSSEIDKLYLPHLYNIHGIYLAQLRPNQQKVNMNEITLYLHKQPWQRISFLIKKTVDTMNSLS